MELKRNFSENIRNFRTSRGSSLEEFADIVGIGKTTLQDIENGKANSTLDTIETIAKGLNVNPIVLLTEIGSPLEFAVLLSVLRISEYFAKLSIEKQIEAAGYLKNFILLLTESDI